MNRILLTLLALLTGLTAQAGPAQAQLRAGDAAANAAVGAAEFVQCVQRAVAIRVASVAGVAARLDGQLQQPLRPVLAQVAKVPTVRFAADRAYE
jgi:hypothetical protein